VSRFVFARCMSHVLDVRHKDYGAETSDGAIHLAKQIHKSTGEPAYVFDATDPTAPPRPRGVYDRRGWTLIEPCHKCGGSGSIIRRVKATPGLTQQVTCTLCSGTRYIEKETP